MLNFYEYLKQIKQNGKFNHSLIVHNHFCFDYLTIIKMYLKALVCNKKNPYCDECFYCNKINKDAYIDLIYLDHNEQNAISKQDIIDLQERFSKPGVEEVDIKLYVIKNIEQTNKQILNSLLKFIEENPKHTYNLFFSLNPNKIIDTILSRSSLININDKIEIDEQNKDLIELVFNDYNDYLLFKQDYSFDDLVLLAKQLNENHSSEQLSILAKKLSQLSKYEFYIFLRILLEINDINKKQIILNFLNDLKLNMNVKNIIMQLIIFYRK